MAVRRPLLLTLALFAATAAQAQVGSGNGNGNSGAGNGNGNGNTSTNTLSASAGAGASSALTIRGGRNTPSILAPGLAAAGIESCLGSASVGGAGPGFGITIGSTTTDKGCNLRLYARTLYSLGHTVAATQILCNDPEVAAALAVEGVRCLSGASAEAQRALSPPVPEAYGAMADLDSEVRSEPEDILPRRAPRRRHARAKDAR